MKGVCIAFVLVIGSLLGNTQEPFSSKPGAYMEGLAFSKGIPDYALAELIIHGYVSQTDEYARVLIRDNRTGLVIQPRVFCQSDACYYWDDQMGGDTIQYLTPMIEIGPICLFHMKRTFQEDIPMPVYNPKSGKVLYNGKVSRPVERIYLMAWNVQDDIIMSYVPDICRKWTGAYLPENPREQDLIQITRQFNQYFLAQQFNEE